MQPGKATEKVLCFYCKTENRYPFPRWMLTPDPGCGMIIVLGRILRPLFLRKKEVTLDRCSCSDQGSLHVILGI